MAASSADLNADGSIIALAEVTYGEFAQAHTDAFREFHADGGVSPDLRQGRYVHPATGEPWVLEDPASYASYSWKKNTNFMKAVCANKDALCAVQQTDPMDFIHEMGGLSRIHDRIWVGSVAGMEKRAEYNIPLETSVRICLAGKVDDKGTYAEAHTLEPMLDDAAPPTPAVPMSDEQFTRFAGLLKTALREWKKGKTLVIHCSQGQSRSVTFATCLLMLLRGFSADFENVPPTAADNPDQLLAEAYRTITSSRRAADPNPRWYTFLDYVSKKIWKLAEPELRARMLKRAKTLEGHLTALQQREEGDPLALTIRLSPVERAVRKLSDEEMGLGDVKALIREMGDGADHDGVLADMQTILNG